MAHGIYVEITIRTSLDRIWEATQHPDRHARWDLRFTEITYLPKEGADAPQRFEYATRIGFGLGIRGKGESVGTREGPGARTSSLRFWSDDRKSLIRTGSGYWKYTVVPDGVRFLTWYDYETRFGRFGAAIDRFLFRPLLGWATAWSFDRLRLWLESGVDPKLSLLRSAASLASRAALAFAWVYQGLVPKILARSAGERALLEGIVPGRADRLLPVLGVAEIAFGAAFLAFPRLRALHVLNVLGLLALGAGALLGDAAIYLAPFNPASLTATMVALSVVGLLAERDLASARRCARRPPRGGSA